MSFSDVRLLMEHHIDWMDSGIVEVYSEPVFGQGIRSTYDLYLPPAPHVAVVGYISGRLLSKQHVDAIEDKNQLRYMYHLGDQTYIDLATQWLGKINHGSPLTANVRFDSARIVQARVIAAGDPLLVEYGLDYWVLQLTNIDLDLWPRGYVATWQQLYKTTDDYTAYLNAGLHEMGDDFSRIILEVRRLMRGNRRHRHPSLPPASNASRRMTSVTTRE
jgi:hypothetical protein